jgi:hypothetical protein
MFPGDLPRLDRPLPKALDDAAAAKLLRAAQGDHRMLVRVTVEMLLRTGLRVSQYTSLRAGAVVLIGAGPWLHVPVGKLHQDRYLPLPPQLVTIYADHRGPRNIRICREPRHTAASRWMMLRELPGRCVYLVVVCAADCGSATTPAAKRTPAARRAVDTVDLPGVLPRLPRVRVRLLAPLAFQRLAEFAPHLVLGTFRS